MRRLLIPATPPIVVCVLVVLVELAASAFGDALWRTVPVARQPVTQTTWETAPPPPREKTTPTSAGDRPVEAERVADLNQILRDRRALDPLGAPECRGMNLPIVSEFQADPLASIAVVQAAGAWHSVQRGDTIFGHRVVLVGHNRRRMTPAIWMWDEDNRLCQVSQRVRHAGQSAADAHAGHTAAAAKSKARPFERWVEVTASGVAVDRQLVHEILRAPATWIGSVRVAPARPGTTDGPRLVGIREGSLLATLGMKNGDVVTSINDVSTRDMGQVFAQLPALARASRLVVHVVRQGKPMSLAIDIR